MFTVIFYNPLYFRGANCNFSFIGAFSVLLHEAGSSFINFVYLFKESALSLMDHFSCFVASVSFISTLTFMISFPLLTLDFVCSAFSSYLKCTVRLFEFFVCCFVS